MQLFHIIVAIVQMQQIFIVSSLNEKPYFPLYKRPLQFLGKKLGTFLLQYSTY